MMITLLLLLSILALAGLLILLLPYGRHALVEFEEAEHVLFEEEGVLVIERRSKGKAYQHPESRLSVTEHRIVLSRPLMRWRRPQFNLLLYFSERELPSEIRCLQGSFRVGLIDRGQVTLGEAKRSVILEVAPPSAGCGPIPVRSIPDTLTIEIFSQQPESLAQTIRGIESL